MTLPFMASLNLKLKTTFIRSRIFHKNICISMKHAHSPYAHIILQMLSTHWVKFKPISYFMPKSYTVCAVSALTAVDVAQYTPSKQRSIKNMIKRRSMLPVHKGKP